MITYRAQGLDYRVFLSGKNVGTIKRVDGGKWQYFPKGSKVGGEPDYSLAVVKASLESN